MTGNTYNLKIMQCPFKYKVQHGWSAVLGAIDYLLIFISLACINIVVANIASVFLGVDKP